MLMVITLSHKIIRAINHRETTLFLVHLRNQRNKNDILIGAIL